MKAVIGTDGSACAQVAIDLAAHLPWPDDSTLRIAGVLDFASAYGPFIGWASDLEALQDDAVKALDEAVAAASSDLSAPGRRVERCVPFGRASTVLCNEAAAMGADLIMLGSRGHGRISTMLLGSVSAEVIDHAGRPVLVARHRSLRHVLLAADGSDNAYAAERVVRDWPIFAGVRVDVISVAEDEREWDRFVTTDEASSSSWRERTDHTWQRQHETIADAAARRLAASGHIGETIVPAGDAAHEITRIASQRGADLVVLGTHGNTGLRRLLLGSVARNVLLHASCSVLVVPFERPAQQP
jgi:nucleotide-binding universal stress UspA family protein